jgi:hypothetical protein
MTRTNLAVNIRMFMNVVVAAAGGKRTGAAASLSHTAIRVRGGS